MHPSESRTLVTVKPRFGSGDRFGFCRVGVALRDINHRFLFIPNAFVRCTVPLLAQTEPVPPFPASLRTAHEKSAPKGCAPQGRAARKAALFRDNGIKNPPKASALRGFCALFSRKNSSLCGCEAVFEEQNCLIRQSRKPQETCRFSRIPAQHLGSFAFKNRRFLAQHTPRGAFFISAIQSSFRDSCRSARPRPRRQAAWRPLQC